MSASASNWKKKLARSDKEETSDNLNECRHLSGLSKKNKQEGGRNKRNKKTQPVRSMGGELTEKKNISRAYSARGAAA